MYSKQVTGILEAYNAVYAPQELNEVELWVNSLIEEGYDLSEYTWDEMYDTYFVNEFNTIVNGLIEEGYDLSEYTEEELVDIFVAENILPSLAKLIVGINKAAGPVAKGAGEFAKGVASGVSGTAKLAGAVLTGGSKGGALAKTAGKGGALVKSSGGALAKTAKGGALVSTGVKPVNVKDLGTSAAKAAKGAAGGKGGALVASPGGPGGNKNGKMAAGLGLGLLGLGALASMNRGGGGNETGAGKIVSTAVPGNGGSPRRKEQLVGVKGGLKATDPIIMSQAKNVNKKGGISLGSGGTGYLAKQGDKLVVVQSKGIGADDGIIGKAARALGLTRDKDKALEAQRQNRSRANRGGYLQAQGLTDPNVTGYQAKGAIRKGEKTGLNIKSSYEYDRFDTVLEYLMTEGYADTNESALVIMANMSEEWRESIVENRGMSYSGGKPGASGDGSKPKGITGGKTYQMPGFDDDSTQKPKLKGV